MEDYTADGRLITTDDWENWMKSKEEYSDKRLSNMRETPTKKETKYAVIEWHKYPEEKPKEDKKYLLSVNMWGKSFTYTSSWLTSKNVFEDIWEKCIYACSDLTYPYNEQNNYKNTTN